MKKASIKSCTVLYIEKIIILFLWKGNGKTQLKMHFEFYTRNKEPSQKSLCMTERVICYAFQEKKRLVYKIWHYEEKQLPTR